jgi:predicted Rossmann-fold nucleotide-binding protein
MNQGAADGKGSIVGVIHGMFLVDGKLGHHEVFDQTGNIAGGGYRELQLAGGKDLQERKQRLMTGADAIIVMPGGTGTFDEVGIMSFLLIENALFELAPLNASLFTMSVFSL